MEIMSSDVPDPEIRHEVFPVSMAETQNKEHELHPGWETHTQNPFNWSTIKKRRQFLVGCLVTLLVGLNSTAIATPGAAIAEQFDITYALFLLFVVPQAVAQSFATVVVTRVFAGVFGGVLMNCLACFVADTWLDDAERDLYITLFILVYLAGVTVGPAFGALVAVLQWRWIFYIQLIIYGALFPLLFFAIKETRGPVIRARIPQMNATLSPPTFKDTSKEQKPDVDSMATPALSDPHSLKSLLYAAAIRPFHMLFTEPVIAAFTLWSGLCFGIVYTGIQSVGQIYTVNYSFSAAQCGLLQLAVLVGLVLGLIPCLLQNSYYQRCTAQNNNIPIPERRLPVSILASLFGLTGGLFWYAWASCPYLHWILPTIGLAFIGFGVQVVVTSVGLYIADAYSLFAGSALSAVGFGENLMAAWLPLATKRMYGTLGNQWASALLGFATLALAAAPIALVVWGEGVRGRSRFIKEARYLG
ncbi:MAG: hypothetical protein Q9220_003100 [cf. Caloplaca sp. 1 TL-2023]